MHIYNTDYVSSKLYSKAYSQSELFLKHNKNSLSISDIMTLLNSVLTIAAFLAARSHCTNMETSEPQLQTSLRTLAYPKCKNLTPEWMLNDTNKKIIDKFFVYDYQLRETCNNTANFYIFGNYLCS